MIKVRKSAERGHFNHGWLDTYHTFSFDQYYDPSHVHFGSLRVINEDRVGPNRGFPMHSHRDMEIITYVLEGTLAHRDSMGNGSTIQPGEVQRMTAGTGVSHSEANPSRTDPVHLLQIWILPNARNLPPSYEQKMFANELSSGDLRLIASDDGRDGSVAMNQDAKIYAARMNVGKEVGHSLAGGRKAWLQVARGAVAINDTTLNQGDGAGITGETELRIVANEPAEILLFDLA